MAMFTHAEKLHEEGVILNVYLLEYNLCNPPNGFILKIDFESFTLLVEINRDGPGFKLKPYTKKVIKTPVISFAEMFNIVWPADVKLFKSIDTNTAVKMPVIMYFEKNEGNAFFYDEIAKDLIYDGKMGIMMEFDRHPLCRKAAD